MGAKGDSGIYSNWCTCNNPYTIGKGTRSLWNQRTSGDHTNYSIIEISKNIEKSPGYLKRPAVNQAPVKDHYLTLVLKNLK